MAYFFIFIEHNYLTKRYYICFCFENTMSIGIVIGKKSVFALNK